MSGAALQPLRALPGRFGTAMLQIPFGLSLPEPFDRLRANGSSFSLPDH